MRDSSSAVVIGMIGMLLQDGVIIDKFDEINRCMYLSIPEDSYAYHDDRSGVIYNAESYVKRNKEMLSELMKLPDLKVKYKTYPGYWTKEQGMKNFKEHVSEFT